MASPASSSSKPPPIGSKGAELTAHADAQLNWPNAPKKNPKEMTKAERRELQERQRASKAANTASGTKGQPKGAGKDSTASPAGKKPAGSADSSKTAHAQGSSHSVHAHMSAQSQQAQLQQSQTRGLRIFSHFGLTKPPSNIKGDAQIHPAVVRLGLQFAAFKIVGANARCIATLTALKNVSRCLALGE